MRKITFSYSIVFFFLIILLSIIYYFTAYHNFLQNHTRISRQLAKTISNQIDTQGSKFNNLEIRILESEEIMKYIFEEAKQHNVVSDWEFRKNLYAITGYNYEFYQLNIVNLNESTIHTFGEEYYYKPYTITRNVQENIIEPVRTYNRLTTVDGKVTVRNIFVLPKLTLPDDKLLVVEIYEKGGARHQSFRIENTDLVAAKPISELHII